MPYTEHTPSANRRTMAKAFYLIADIERVCFARIVQIHCLFYWLFGSLVFICCLIERNELKQKKREKSHSWCQRQLLSFSSAPTENWNRRFFNLIPNRAFPIVILQLNWKFACELVSFLFQTEINETKLALKIGEKKFSCFFSVSIRLAIGLVLACCVRDFESESEIHQKKKQIGLNFIFWAAIEIEIISDQFNSVILNRHGDYTQFHKYVMRSLSIRLSRRHATRMKPIWIKYEIHFRQFPCGMIPIVCGRIRSPCVMHAIGSFSLSTWIVSGV